jgi:Fe-S oxidoreductase
MKVASREKIPVTARGAGTNLTGGSVPTRGGIALVFTKMEEANACCGEGGSFQFDFPEISKRITEKKIRRIRETGARVIATGCPGCRVPIGGNMVQEARIAVLHPMQLLDWALAGKGLDKLPG